jgi:8-oxo-dGTP diphosphatase
VISVDGDGVVRAAGGLVWRSGDGGEPETLLVHRPKYDDWSFPKGKCDVDEDDERCAVREVEEETGLRCRLGDELPTSEYTDPKGRPKRVRYWAMTPVDGEFEPTDEIDEIRWCTLTEARDVLSYRRDVVILDALAELAEGA